ncbi:hypothetical protein [Streptomyces sp. NPDC047706]|uniref:hypothetical protein n=1 Tax=Streptomyces sp. NPDC047706 TaxID=3365486 RepID=UPI0037106F1A
MRKGVKAAVVGGVFAVMVGGAGYGTFNFVSALNGDGGTAAAGESEPLRTGPPTDAEVRETVRQFFAAREQGPGEKAASGRRGGGPDRGGRPACGWLTSPAQAGTLGWCRRWGL